MHTVMTQLTCMSRTVTKVTRLLVLLGVGCDRGERVMVDTPRLEVVRFAGVSPYTHSYSVRPLENSPYADPPLIVDIALALV